MAEGMRSASAGIGAFFALAGYGTIRTEGKFDVKIADGKNPAIKNVPKEVKEFNGRKYILE